MIAGIGFLCFALGFSLGIWFGAIVTASAFKRMQPEEFKHWHERANR